MAVGDLNLAVLDRDIYDGVKNEVLAVVSASLHRFSSGGVSVRKQKKKKKKKKKKKQTYQNPTTTLVYMSASFRVSTPTMGLRDRSASLLASSLCRPAPKAASQ